VAASFGVPFTPRTRMPCTRPALAIAELARRQGKLDAWRTLAMDAHWVEGRDIEDRAVLGELAGRAGLDPAEAVAFLDTAEVPGLLAAQRNVAQRWGVTGIPTWFVLPDGWREGDPLPTAGPRPVRVVGCQPMDVVDQAARAAGAVGATD
jgi:predicted DsbA family dithiol-disulfide isomerase